MKFKYKITALLVAVLLMACGASACSCFGISDKEDVINAYDIAVKNGFIGTEAEWLESLKGKDGLSSTTVYKSLYEEAVERGFVGSFDDFVSKYISDYINNSNEKNVSVAADTAMRSAVSVYSTFSKITYTFDRRGNRKEHKEEYTGAGSGVIVSLDETAGNAYIITNFHVIYDVNDTDGYADKVNLYVFGREVSGREVRAKIIGATATYDVAVLKVENSEVFRSSNLVASKFADSGLVGAGDEIFAVGNPEASGIAITSGIVSVDSEYITMTSPKDNVTNVNYRAIRIDAAINGGNSGGGLFNLDGEIVGIVNAKVVSTEIDNIAYAIPSAIVEKVYENILKNCDGNENKSVKKGFIGLEIKIADSYAYYDPLFLDTRIIHKIEISSVDKNGSAYGKLQVGDVIKKFEYDGKVYEVERMHDLTDSTLFLENGSVVKYTVERNGQDIDVLLTINNTTVID